MAMNEEREFIKAVVDDIKDLKIQGNTNIAKTSVKTLVSYLKKYGDNYKYNHHQLALHLKEFGDELAKARNNEPLAINAVKFITQGLEDTKTHHDLKVKFAEKSRDFFKYIDESYEIIRKNAVNLLQGYEVFYNHCHSSLARDVLLELNANKRITVINDETRPKLQGRITAQKLIEGGVNVMHTIDSAVSSIFLDERYVKPQVVVVGSDGITVDGALINKVGTYNIALASYEAQVPFYVVCQSMKVDLRSKDGDTILPIEQRHPDEVWKLRPTEVEIINPAFDLVPGKYITGGYITERGLVKPEDVHELV